MTLPPSWKSEVQETVEEAANADRKQRQTEHNDAAAEIVAAINALRDAQNAQTGSEDRNEKKDRAISIATLLLVFLTVVFTFLTWRTLSGQLEEMKSASEQTKQIIEANSKLVEAATKQADAAAESAKTTRDAYIAAQRAWVGPNNARVVGEVAIGKPLKIAVEYLNTGREPAINFTTTADLFTATADEDSRGVAFQKINAYFNGCKGAQVAGGGTVVLPSIGGGLGNATSQTLTLDKPDSFVDQEIIDGDKTIIVDGCFLYRSIGAIRHTYFCYFYNGKRTTPGNLNICTNGNGAD